MKKKTLLCCVLLVIFALCGCDKDNKGKSDAAILSDTKSLVEYGMDIVRLMDEALRSDDYAEMMLTSDSGMQDIVSKIAEGDYSEPEDVYRITFDQDSYLLYLSMSGMSVDEMSDELKEVMKNRFHTSLSNMINGQQLGASYLATASVYSVSKSFVSSEISEDVIYLYTFDTGYPIMVTFVTGDNGAVTAYGTFILSNELIDADLSQVEDLMKMTCLSGYKVEKLED